MSATDDTSAPGDKSAHSLHRLVSQQWPNNKPKLVTEKQLFDRGMAIECREPASPFGYTPVWCVNIFGVHELHLLANEKAEPRRH